MYQKQVSQSDFALDNVRIQRANPGFALACKSHTELYNFVTDFQDKFYPEVLGGVFVTYLFLQTFAIPGSIFLSIVSGYLFRFPVALLLICFCSATGASFCYLLSYLAGKPLVHKYLPER